MDRNFIDQEIKPASMSNIDPFNNQMESLIQNELNSNNFESNINLAFNNLTEMMNMNNSDCLLSEGNTETAIILDENETSSIFLDNPLLFNTQESTAPAPQKTQFNYKCKYCTIFVTKYKAQIIKHMQINHKVFLMQCPQQSCLKRFKDEWKLKKHLISNKDHPEMIEFKTLHDVMKLHVEITPKKSGFSCPFCQIDQTNSKQILNDTQVNNLKGENYLVDYLNFNTYNELEAHFLSSHSTFPIDSYSICKQCGQVFKSRYKLSSHIFNVHSGKKKTLKKKFEKLDGLNPEVNDHMNLVIDSVANGSTSVNLDQSNESDIKINCIICQKSYERSADLMRHIKLQHKNISKTDLTEQQSLIDLYNDLSNLNNFKQKQQQNDNNKRVCFVCNKIFRGLNTKNFIKTTNCLRTSNLNKTFTRHMQIQHGLDENGERLIECPVCEKNFFNQQQLERHMHTHEVWIYSEDTQIIKSKVKDSEMPDFQNKHSILYCHECVECKLFYKSIKVLTAHKLESHGLKPVYKCANVINCGHEFENVREFLAHSKLHPQKNITCQRCKIKFNSKNLLRHHMKNVHYKQKMQTTFKKARLKSPTDSLLKTDLEDHNSLTKEQNTSESSIDSKHSCPTCKLDFTSRNSLHNHLATHNSSELRLFLCDLCGHSFKTRKDLSKHASLHDSSKHKTCQECGMTFKTSFHLKRHSLTRHSNIRPYKCTECDMNFARKDKLKQHQAKHINHPLYQCGKCSKGFYRKEHLKDHEISKHSKEYPFSCEHCNKGFVHSKDLHRHIRVRHLGSTIKTPKSNSQQPLKPTKSESPQPKEEPPLKSNDFKSKKISSILKSTVFNNAQNKPQAIQQSKFIKLNVDFKSFKCQHCDKDFFYENHLRKHILSKHTVTPLFACSYCNKGFSTKSTAKSHVENSHVEFNCPLCLKLFKNRSHTQRHILSVHSNCAQATIAKPIKITRNDARLVDLSSVNINMLNLISIDSTKNAQTPDKVQPIVDHEISVIDSNVEVMYCDNYQFNDPQNTCHLISPTINSYCGLKPLVTNNPVLPSIKYLHNSSLVPHENGLQANDLIGGASSVFVLNNNNNSQIIGLPQIDINFMENSYKNTC